MGYVPPQPPRGDGPPDFGVQQFGSGGPRFAPTAPFQRYLWDLYGPPGRDWMPAMRWGLLLSAMALVAVVLLRFV